MEWIDFNKKQPEDGQWCLFICQDDGILGPSVAYAGIGRYDQGDARFINDFCDPYHELWDENIKCWIPYPESECPLDRNNWPRIDDNGRIVLNDG